MNRDILLETITKILFPFIVGFTFYIQLSGDASPGGGFQSGMVLGSAFILYGLVFGLKKLNKFLSERVLDFCLVLGVLIYGGTGIYCVLQGGEFLNYYLISNDFTKSQHLGITIVEIGVGFTVFAVTLKIFYHFAQWDNHDFIK